MSTTQSPAVIIHASPLWDEDVAAYEIARRGTTRVMIFRFAFTVAIMTVEPPEKWYTQRWCFETAEGALRAALSWLRGGGAEPEGWVRHYPSGRYRENGDPALEEYVTRVGG